MMDTLIKRLETLERRNADLENRNQELEKRVKRLEKDGKPESFYQKHLEQKYGASHTVNLYGITDIETEDSVIEIKHWRNYKNP